MTTERKVDRRILRTRRRLSEALVELIFENDTTRSPCRAMLDRADVGRSTFYLHFRYHVSAGAVRRPEDPHGDKDALLEAGIGMLREQLVDVQRDAAATTRDPAEHAIAFSGFLFEHVDEHRGLYRGLGRHGGEIVRRGFRAMIKQAIDDAGPSARSGSAARVPADLLADVVASTFMILIEWLIRQRRPPSAGVMNEYFRALVLPTLCENARSGR